MIKEKILAIVLAGGEGTRLSPLTATRSKPAVPFGGRYRIVDFVLSNLVNSQIYSIYMLVQYRSQSLIEHIRNAWVLAPIISDHFITVVPPQMAEGPEWFAGTADAVYQNLNLIRHENPTLVVVFGADHVYRMDVSQMIDFHRSRNADVTVAALPVPVADATAFGVIGVDREGRVLEFQEKPERPKTMPSDPTRAYASMGNYIFNADILIAAVEEGRERGEHDFGRHVLPRLVDTHRLYAYDFASNQVPGVKPHEEHGYWRDVGTLDAYFESAMDTLGLTPRFDLFNPRWPIRSTSFQGPPARIGSARIESSDIATGGVIRNATVRHSVIRREVTIEEDVVIEDCVIMDFCVLRKGARLRRAIVDRYNVIAAGARIGYDLDADASRYTVTDSGIVVVPIADIGTRAGRYAE
ncbi:MAG: glucose-1-phosphate adenylyltransferase [Betaproteobacteria bacterium RIFCSPLOWO2_12_FULL_63_13]|nr:MAG: glucose-1-phosphate adenylyltransferase [Betaproteobacteria bacterium RIFCSPLOWO2_12_FULL_63_13]